MRSGLSAGRRPAEGLELEGRSRSGNETQWIRGRQRGKGNRGNQLSPIF
jgi:hypothetical protein